MSMLDRGQERGEIKEEGRRMIDSIFEFDDLLAYEIMTPRTDVFMFDLNDDRNEYFDELMELTHSRIPVYEESIDNIIGVLVVQNLLRLLTDTPKEKIDIRSLLVEPYYIHMTVKLPDALDVLREERTHIMIVLDEFGGTMGIATMEDILEELVGEIWDEDEEAEHDIIKSGPDKYTVEGDMNIFDFFDAIGFNYGDFESEYTTVGGWAIEMLEGFPEEGATFSYENLTVTIDTIEDHRITKLIALVIPIEKEED
jgi:putative hemolysin